MQRTVYKQQSYTKISQVPQISKYKTVHAKITLVSLNKSAPNILNPHLSRTASSHSSSHLSDWIFALTFPLSWSKNTKYNNVGLYYIQVNLLHCIQFQISDGYDFKSSTSINSPKWKDPEMAINYCDRLIVTMSQWPMKVSSVILLLVLINSSKYIPITILPSPSHLKI